MGRCMTILEILTFYVDELRVPIFPVIISREGNKTNKKPAVEWKKYQTELPTHEQLASWASKYTAWGMPTGEKSRIVVVDVDMQGLEGAEQILGVDLHSTMTVTTASGGTHLYYKWEEELRNTTKIENAPIDFRGDGGFVVIPPTTSQWGSYTWRKTPNSSLKMMLPDLPKQIKTLLSSGKTHVHINVGDGEVFRDGNRNAASTVALRKLLGEIPQSQWPTTGWFAFTHWCKTYCEPELDDVQIKATFNWWVGTNVQKGKAPVLTTKEAGDLRNLDRAIEKTAPKTGYPCLDEQMIGWIPGHLYILTGETNAGKTAAACNFMYRVQQQGKKVTYFALEPDLGVMEFIAGIHHKKRWKDITDEDIAVDLPGILIYQKESHSKLTDLLHTIKTMDRQDLIIVDHIGYFTSNPSDKRSKTDQESDAIKQIVGAAKKQQCAIMIIAHPRKPSNGSGKTLTMNEISGSASFKQDATDVLILHMDKDKGDEHHLKNLPKGVILLPKIKTGKSGGYVPIYFVPESPVMLEESENADAQARGF